MSENKLFKELEGAMSVELFNDTECRVEMLNSSPRDLEVYIYGVCEFVYDDGSTSLDRQLGKHYHGGSVKWRSNQPLKCVKRVNIALIAKSHKYPGEGKYAIADGAPQDQCILQRGWKFGEAKNISETKKDFESRFCLVKLDE